MAENEEKSKDAVVDKGELRKVLSEYFDDMMGMPLCDTMLHSVNEFADQDAVYHELEEEEDSCEKEYMKVLGKLGQADEDAVSRYVEAVEKMADKKTDIAYMAGARDAILMLRYLDVIKDRK